MDFDTNPQSSETQDSKINVYNVVLSYVIEMNEFRSQLFTTDAMTGVTPSSYKDFIRTFFKLFTFTQSMLPLDLQKEIQTYFNNQPKKQDPSGRDGISLSLKMQKELENQRMITLYEETIVPPFVEPGDDDGVPDLLKKKTILNPVTKTKYQISNREELIKNADKIKGLWSQKKGSKS